MHAILESWLGEIRRTELHHTGHAEELALKNLIAFSSSTEEAESMALEDIDAFLIAAYRQYVLKLSSAPQTLYFYAWHDEHAGQLRMSAATADEPEELPFGCRLECITSPTPVSQKFKSSNYLDGIPDAELDEPGVDPAADRWDSDFTLTVFARRILTTV